jgi:trk system potassium uptake protein TrkA
MIIVGLGGIGRTLVAYATERGNSVVVIDKNEARCNEILEEYDVLVIAGNATNTNILHEAGIDKADVLITTTSDDAVNLMTCWLAKKLDVPHVISIVNEKEHYELFDSVGVTINENPDDLVAARLYLWASHPTLRKLAEVSGGVILEVDVEPNCRMTDQELRTLHVQDFVLIAIQRAGGELIIPSGSVRFRPGDKVTIFAKQSAEDSTLKVLQDSFSSKK